MKNPFRRNAKEKMNMDKEQVKRMEGSGQESGSAALPKDQTDMPDSATDGTGTDPNNLEGELDILRTEHQALHDKHLRLFAEFDNFRKRTARERIEMLQFAGENVLKAILPVLDDMDRAIKNNESSTDVQAVKEGVKLIHQKLQHALTAQGLKAMNVQKGERFDTDKHEAITKAPAGEDALKGAVVDVVEDGYLLQGKVIRYAKVVVGE